MFTFFYDVKSISLATIGAVFYDAPLRLCVFFVFWRLYNKKPFRLILSMRKSPESFIKKGSTIMKKRNKIVAILLVLVMATGVFAVAPIAVSAAAKDWAGGDCVTYARARFQEVYGFELHWPGDNARGYYTNAGNYGDTTSSTPAAGCLAVWDNGNAGFSHVAFVEEVSGNSYKISEGGYDGHYNERWFTVGSNISWTDKYGVYYYQTFLGFVYVSGAVWNPTPPTNVWFNIGNQNNIFTKDNSLTFWFGADNATNYYIGIDRNGERVLTQEVTYGITIPFYVSGYYTAYISAVNNYGYIDSQKVYFCVFDPRDIGDDFYASISTTDKSKRITSDNNGNVSIQASNDSDSQIWHFIKNSDRSYRIVNKVTQGDLNVTYGTSVYDRTVNAVTDNYDENTNLWYLRQRPNGFAIASKLNTCTTIDGSEEVLRNREANDSDVQTFCIDYIGMEPVKAKIYRNHIYEYFPLTTTWTKAEEICQLRGGHLATVSNSVENDFLYHFADEFDREYLWLGGIYNHNVGWNWVTAEEFSYTNWSTNQPDNNLNQEYYLNMYIKHPVQGAWNDMLEADEYDHRSFGFICERELTHTIGDSNQDNRITIHDVTAIQRAQAELEAFTIEQLAIADTNGDGVTDINDATHLQQYLAEFNVTLG